LFHRRKISKTARQFYSLGGSAVLQHRESIVVGSALQTP